MMLVGYGIDFVKWDNTYLIMGFPLASQPKITCILGGCCSSCTYICEDGRAGASLYMLP